MIAKKKLFLWKGCLRYVYRWQFYLMFGISIRERSRRKWLMTLYKEIEPKLSDDTKSFIYFYEYLTTKIKENSVR